MKGVFLFLAYFVRLVADGHEMRLFESCPDIPAMDSFEFDKFLGKWYIIEIIGGFNTCMTLTFEKIGDNKIKVTQDRLVRILSYLNIGPNRSYSGIMTMNSEIPSAMELKWAANPIKMDFKVINTDYDNFALIFECQKYLIVSRKSAAILSRNETLEEAVLEEARLQIFETGLDPKSLRSIDQDKCRMNNKTLSNLNETSSDVSQNADENLTTFSETE